MRVLSLFTGIGGFDLGLQMAGCEIVGQVEIDFYCNRILKEHWPHVARWTDIRDVTADDITASCGAIDLICGGFPCQDISTAGKGAGLDGERSSMWWHMHRLIQEIRPAWIIVENVDAIRNRGLDRVVGALESDDFQVWCFRMAAENLGAPHQRKRMLILAHDTRIRKPRPSGQNRGGVRAIGGSNQLADTDNGGQQRGSISEKGREHISQSDRSGPAMANDSGKRLGARRAKSAGQQRASSSTGSSPSMADTDSQHGAAGTLETGQALVATGSLGKEPGSDRDLANTISGGGKTRKLPYGSKTAELVAAEHHREISDTDCDTIRIEQGRPKQRWPYSPFAFPAHPGQGQHPWEESRTVESALGVTADGIPLRLALHACGNGLIPAIPFVLGRAIQRLERHIEQAEKDNKRAKRKNK